MNEIETEPAERWKRSERWEPISGVDLKTFARVSAVLLTRGATGQQADALVEALGIPASVWSAAKDGWSHRIAGDSDVRDAYSELYRRARGRARQAP